jgi:hypothetical protein
MVGGVMYKSPALWLDCDLSSFTMLLIGIGAVSLMALIGS